MTLLGGGAFWKLNKSIDVLSPRSGARVWQLPSRISSLMLVRTIVSDTHRVHSLLAPSCMTHSTPPASAPSSPDPSAAAPSSAAADLSVDLLPLLQSAAADLTINRLLLFVARDLQPEQDRHLVMERFDLSGALEQFGDDDADPVRLETVEPAQLAEWLQLRYAGDNVRARLTSWLEQMAVAAPRIDRDERPARQGILAGWFCRARAGGGIGGHESQSKSGLCDCSVSSCRSVLQQARDVLA